MSDETANTGKVDLILLMNCTRAADILSASAGQTAVRVSYLH
jgi:hypothetical protein